MCSLSSGPIKLNASSTACRPFSLPSDDTHHVRGRFSSGIFTEFFTTRTEASSNLRVSIPGFVHTV
jgi:hypothetical protein